MKAPLYEKYRPRSFDEVVGQEHLVGKGGILQRTIEKNHPLSFVLIGPPGCGKTTIARLYAKAFSIPFFSLSGAEGQVAEAKKILKEIEGSPLIYRHAILFVDEIHRINKAGQDIFLPHLEKGTITLLAATTENPSFTLNNALLSRMQVLEMKPLHEPHLQVVLEKYLKNETEITLTDDARSFLLRNSEGDARYLFNMLETLSLSCTGTLTSDELATLLQKKRAQYDKKGDGHFNLISTLHKAIRSSDPDAALYWFARIISAGEDSKYVGRRLLRMAIEDIGLADPEALNITQNAVSMYERVGSPEGELALAQAVVYLSLAPKSNAVYLAYKKALLAAEKIPNGTPPKHALNAPTKLMKKLGYGKGYVYDHDTEYGCSGLSYFPENLEGSLKFYSPKNRGFERELQKRAFFYEKIREEYKLGSEKAVDA